MAWVTACVGGGGGGGGRCAGMCAWERIERGKQRERDSNLAFTIVFIFYNLGTLSWVCFTGGGIRLGRCFILICVAVFLLIANSSVQSVSKFLCVLYPWTMQFLMLHVLILCLMSYSSVSCVMFVLQTPHQQTDKLDLNKYPDRICGGGGFGPVSCLTF